MPKLTPRRRGQGGIDPTTPKSYTLPYYVILELRKLASEYGSQGRALQVAIFGPKKERQESAGLNRRHICHRAGYPLQSLPLWDEMQGKLHVLSGFGIQFGGCLLC